MSAGRDGMYTIWAIISGVLISLTVMQNGDMSDFYGSYSGAVLIHFVGLVTVLAFFIFMRKTLPAKQKASPWMYMGGIVGVGTLVFTTMAYQHLGVMAITALGLLGQCISSIIVDHFGLFGAQKNPFFSGRSLAVLAVLAGAVVMIVPIGDTSMAAVLMALASGVTIVCSRVINGRLALRQGAMRSTVMNYVTGLLTSAVFMLVLGMGEPLWTAPAWSSNWFMYTGGAVGVCLIMLLNITVPRVPSFAFTLLQFTGQIFSGMLLDTLLTGVFSVRSLIGGLLVATGLSLDAWMSRRRSRRAIS